MADRTALQAAAENLRTRAPNEWETFMVELSALLSEEKEAAISAPVEQVLVMQGRARSIRSLFQLLESAPEAVRKKARTP